MTFPVPGFSVVSGASVYRSLTGNESEVMTIVAEAYRAHGAGKTVNPPSYFLRFPDRPSARIIALPASVMGDDPVDGIKWISSFPQNIERGIPRASAVLILNDPVTGYPYVCMESSIISAVRTAASAAVAARELATARGRQPQRLGFIGCGLIARYIHRYLSALGWDFTEVGAFDTSPKHAATFARHIAEAAPTSTVTVYDSTQEIIEQSDLIVFASTAAHPHVSDPAWFSHHPLVLHVSLRDLDPAVILTAVNIVDDVDHALRAATSLALTEQLTGNRAFIAGNVSDLLNGDIDISSDRTTIFSPFGLGMLDLAVGRYAFARASQRGDTTVVESFFHDLARHSEPDSI